MQNPFLLSNLSKFRVSSLVFVFGWGWGSTLGEQYVIPHDQCWIDGENLTEKRSPLQISKIWLIFAFKHKWNTAFWYKKNLFKPTHCYSPNSTKSFKNLHFHKRHTCMWCGYCAISLEPLYTHMECSHIIKKCGI